MKRFIVSLIIVVCMAVPMPAMAADVDSVPDNEAAADRPVNSDILSDWEGNGYPDDIGGIFYDQDTGRMTILLVNPSIERETELSRLIPGVAFLPSVYSYNELLAVQDDITKEMISQPKGTAVIYSAGIGFTTIDGRVTGFGESGKEFRVVVSVDQSVFDETAARLYQNYGDMVYVESGTAPVTTDGLETPAQAVTNMNWQFVLIALFLLVILGAALILKRRHYNYALQTADGKAVTVSEQVTRRQIVEAVKEATVSPSDGIFDRIQKDLQVKK